MFSNGTQFVMEIYSAKKTADGTFEKDAAGMLLKDKPAKVFVMGKGEGWGQDVPDNIKTGAWVYAAYGPDGQPLKANFAECRACHVPLAQKDFVHRYDEYFEKQAGS
jgi:hemoglobin